ncbi:hypothetical protein TorRG33x02_002590 [Trema orientale]|uniref:Uncharacterized protein n=1 Tax=Trema orientale TaxID=63057 RepID=A0A2P5G1P6_TREOI|nr:hypothetical protein TorRG33x02_002590 [Trema orientale]
MMRTGALIRLIRRRKLYGDLAKMKSKWGEVFWDPGLDSLALKGWMKVFEDRTVDIERMGSRVGIGWEGFDWWGGRWIGRSSGLFLGKWRRGSGIWR